MTNSDNSNRSPERDKTLSSRITKMHGGDFVDGIAPEELVSFNDSECEHKTLVRIEDDLNSNTFACANPNCNEIFIYDKI